ncbi:hypothetical protein H2199_004844 [Coniosporium tulheliwenetii]|uniref:Uncharacterized protein n=1 Tax=Coniosporium tulheliwenetii TaxID=3383036 RepID=A0ACC2Z5G8_9PEZI|nr:hypothetical protein H2199_004844 [Cladosporium sp. JES 115]
MTLRPPTASYIQRLQRPQCLHRQLQQRCFHASIQRDAEAANHYETLGLPQTASAADIKRQFYTLSKQHHPDHNPNDPTASTRFVQISEAYHVLGVAEKRAKYDESLRPRSRHHDAPHHGSYSSHAGSRPASGLSRRRTQFRGPPPSFYRSGGYGTHGAKRREHAPGFGGGGGDAGAGQTSHASAEGAAAGGTGGFGPGQEHPGARGYDNDIPYWDREGHRRTQEGVESRLQRLRRARSGLGEDGAGGASMLFNFFLLSGIVGLVVSLPGLFERKARAQRREREG